VLNVWITSVVSVVLYSTSTASSPSPSSPSLSSPLASSLPPRHKTPSSSYPNPCLSSWLSLYSPYSTTIVFVWVVFASIVVSSVLSFFLSPGFQSYSYAQPCAVGYNRSSPAPVHLFQSGLILSELTFCLCVADDPSILVSVRRLHAAQRQGRGDSGHGGEEEDLEIEILSRVATGNDLLLRLDLAYWEHKYLGSGGLNAEKGREDQHRVWYEGVSSDGWWVRDVTI
jgi:hypothetical protein